MSQGHIADKGRAGIQTRGLSPEPLPFAITSFHARAAFSSRLINTVRPKPDFRGKELCDGLKVSAEWAGKQQCACISYQPRS